MKAIMYHYVRKEFMGHPNFRFLSIDNFIKQLNFIDNKYGFLTRKEWDLVVQGGQLSNDINKKVLLTFDDATVCHFEYVYAELKKRGLWGIFYIPTKPYLNGKILDVHKIHLLCGLIDGKILLKNLLKILDKHMLETKKYEEYEKKIYLNQSNFEGIAETKKILNYFIKYEYRSEIIEKLSKNLEYKFDIKNFYLREKDIKEMHLNGNIIGSHSVTHPVMSKLSRSDQHYEIKESFSFLDSFFVNSHKTYCHPYGGFHSFNRDTVEILNIEKVDYSFNVEKKDFLNIDLIKYRQFLPRYDCNQIVFGNAS